MKNRSKAGVTAGGQATGKDMKDVAGEVGARLQATQRGLVFFFRCSRKPLRGTEQISLGLLEGREKTTVASSWSQTFDGYN